MWRSGLIPGGLALAGVVWLALAGSGVTSRPDLVYAAAAKSARPALDRPDDACRTCHQEIYDRYEKTPMARGSGLAEDGLDAMELRARGFLHEPSGVRYSITLREGQPYLEYERPQTTTRAGLNGEERLDYFIGSGRRGRTFLYERGGLWFEVPVNWYGKKQLWDMAPAFDKATTMPDPLPVDKNCLHCHAGEVDLRETGARNHFSGAPFRQAGVGCAACHGDPAAHLAGVSGGKPGSGPIVNPDKLSPSRRDSVCLQGHLEGDAAIYRPKKSLAGFKPGEELSDSVVYFVDQSRVRAGQRATSQYEALLRSACRRGAGDKLTCTSCHDPHGSPEPAERVAFFRSKCLACHTGEAIATQHHPEQQDCAVCHMPTRKTTDISHEQATDHDIEARPRGEMKSPHTGARELVAVGRVPVTEREEGLAYAQFAERDDRAAAEHALKLLLAAQKNGSDDAEFHKQLGFLLQVSGSTLGAEEQYRRALNEDPREVTVETDLAVLDASKGKTAEAVRLLRNVVTEDPSQTAAGLDLAFLECRMNDKLDARMEVEEMLEYNPDSLPAHEWLEKGSYGGQTCSLK